MEDKEKILRWNFQEAVKELNSISEDVTGGLVTSAKLGSMKQRKENVEKCEKELSEYLKGLENKKLKIIIPIYLIERFVNVKEFTFPEAYKTPMEQINWLKETFNKENIITEKEIVVVTTSPYIAEGLCQLSKELNYDVVFSDGENILSSEQFFFHFAEPMRSLNNK